MTSLDFNPDAVEDSPAEFDVIPPGEYTVIIEADEKRQTKSGDGHYLALTLQIVDGKYAGRKMWANLNLWNKSDVAVRISQQHLKQICVAVGHHGQLNDTGVLHNKPLIAIVKHRLYQGEPQIDVKGFKPLKAETDGSGYSETLPKDRPKPTPAEVSVDAPWGPSS